MSESPLPPLFGKAPPLSCTRVGCGADAAWHVIWTADMQNGLCCDKHADEARATWVFWALHPYELTCSMTDKAVFVEALNRCVLPDPANAELNATRAGNHEEEINGTD